jgi:ParB-like chromosome segregation protein Spo0J
MIPHPANLALSDLDTRHREVRLTDPSRLAAVRESITRHGMLSPLMVNSRTDGTAVLVDGFKRLDVLLERRESSAAVHWLRLDEVEETATIVTSNRPHRGMTHLEEAWIVRRLVRESGLEQQRVGELLGRHKSWVCRRLRLAEALVDPVQEEVRLGLVSATVAREVARLPRGNQIAVVESIRRHALSSRQAAALVAFWLACTDAPTRRALEAEPLAFIGSGPVPERISGDALEDLRQGLERLESCASSVRRRTVTALSVPVERPRRGAIERPLRRVVGVLRDVIIELEAATIAWEVEADVEP